MAIEQSPGRGESLQVRSRAIVAVVVTILVLLVAIAFGLTLAFPDRVGVRFVLHHPFPAPAVIPGERAQRLALQAHAEQLLNGGGGRLPITTAMQKIVARGDHALDPVGP